jgi:hypothetical protein
VVHATRPALLEDIRARGILNPIVILNHRDPTQWERNAVWVGNNRVWAAKQLGWTTIRALVTGECRAPATEVAWEDIQSYTGDGEFFIDRMGWLKLRGMTDFKLGEFPEDSREGVGLHVRDFRDLDV